MKRLFLFLFVIIFVFALTFTIFNLKSHEESQKNSTSPTVRIGLYNGDSSALAVFAKEKGFFQKEGINVEIKMYKSGRDAMAGMLKKEVDYSNSTEYVALKNSYTNNNFKILGSMATARINGMVTKTSSGINEIKQMKHKKIGTTIGTATEYFTGVFLLLNNLTLDDVTLIDIDVDQRESALQKDKIDGLFAWEPFIYNTREKYKNQINYFEMPVGFEFYFILTVNNEYHTQYPFISHKLVKALVEVEKYIKKNQDEFKNFITNYFKYDKQYTTYTLEKHHFSFTFPYPLTMAMLNQAKWLEENKLVKDNLIDIEKLFDTNILNSIDSTKVTVLDRK